MDRNLEQGIYDTDTFRSPSSRRAWIEMGKEVVRVKPVAVALLAEGVDRNGV